MSSTVAVRLPGSAPAGARGSAVRTLRPSTTGAGARSPAARALPALEPAQGGSGSPPRPSTSAAVRSTFGLTASRMPSAARTPPPTQRRQPPRMAGGGGDEDDVKVSIAEARLSTLLPTLGTWLRGDRSRLDELTTGLQRAGVLLSHYEEDAERHRLLAEVARDINVINDPALRMALLESAGTGRHGDEVIEGLRAALGDGSQSARAPTEVGAGDEDVATDDLLHQDGTALLVGQGDVVGDTLKKEEAAREGLELGTISLLDALRDKVSAIRAAVVPTHLWPDGGRGARPQALLLDRVVWYERGARVAAVLANGAGMLCDALGAAQRIGDSELAQARLQLAASDARGRTAHEAALRERRSRLATAPTSIAPAFVAAGTGVGPPGGGAAGALGFGLYAHGYYSRQSQLPLPPSPAAVVCAGVPALGLLWELGQELAKTAAHTFADVARALLIELGGVEVEALGDELCCIFPDVAGGCLFALRLHDALMGAQWPERVLRSPWGGIAYNGDLTGLVDRGPRAAVAIASGELLITTTVVGNLREVALECPTADLAWTMLRHVCRPGETLLTAAAVRGLHSQMGRLDREVDLAPRGRPLALAVFALPKQPPTEVVRIASRDLREREYLPLRSARALRDARTRFSAWVADELRIAEDIVDFVSRTEELLDRGKAPPVALPSADRDTLCLALFDIEGAAAAWAIDAGVALEVVVRYARCLREAAAAYKGIEVRREGEKFCFVFRYAVEAVRMSLRVHKALQEVEWPAAALSPRFPMFAREHLAHPRTGADELAFCGPRVRAALYEPAQGQLRTGADVLGNVVDYRGMGVKILESLHAAARGGETLITRSVASQIIPAAVALDATILRVTAPGRLRYLPLEDLGEGDEAAVYHMLPASLATRLRSLAGDRRRSIASAGLVAPHPATAAIESSSPSFAVSLSGLPDTPAVSPGEGASLSLTAEVPTPATPVPDAAPAAAAAVEVDAVGDTPRTVAATVVGASRYAGLPAWVASQPLAEHWHDSTAAARARTGALERVVDDLRLADVAEAMKERAAAPTVAATCGLVVLSADSALRVFAHRPEEVGTFLAIYTTAVRRCAADYGAYEILRDGDYFVFAVAAPLAAARFACDVHRALLRAPWPDRLLTLKYTRIVRDASGSIVLRGPRLRCGAHFGPVAWHVLRSLDIPPSAAAAAAAANEHALAVAAAAASATRRASLAGARARVAPEVDLMSRHWVCGTAVRVASALHDAARSSETLFSRALFESIQRRLGDSGMPVVSSHGAKLLRPVPETMNVYGAVAEALASRPTPPDVQDVSADIFAFWRTMEAPRRRAGAGSGGEGLMGGKCANCARGDAVTAPRPRMTMIVAQVMALVRAARRIEGDQNVARNLALQYRGQGTQLATRIAGTLLESAAARGENVLSPRSQRAAGLVDAPAPVTLETAHAALGPENASMFDERPGVGAGFAQSFAFDFGISAASGQGGHAPAHSPGVHMRGAPMQRSMTSMASAGTGDDDAMFGTTEESLSPRGGHRAAQGKGTTTGVQTRDSAITRGLLPITAAPRGAPRLRHPPNPARAPPSRVGAAGAPAERECVEVETQTTLGEWLADILDALKLQEGDRDDAVALDVPPTPAPDTARSRVGSPRVRLPLRPGRGGVYGAQSSSRRGSVDPTTAPRRRVSVDPTAAPRRRGSVDPTGAPRRRGSVDPSSAADRPDPYQFKSRLASPAGAHGREESSYTRRDSRDSQGQGEGGARASARRLPRTPSAPKMSRESALAALAQLPAAFGLGALVSPLGGAGFDAFASFASEHRALPAIPGFDGASFASPVTARGGASVASPATARGVQQVSRETLGSAAAVPEAQRTAPGGGPAVSASSAKAGEAVNKADAAAARFAFLCEELSAIAESSAAAIASQTRAVGREVEALKERLADPALAHMRKGLEVQLASMRERARAGGALARALVEMVDRARPEALERLTRDALGAALQQASAPPAPAAAAAPAPPATRGAGSINFPAPATGTSPRARAAGVGASMPARTTAGGTRAGGGFGAPAPSTSPRSAAAARGRVATASTTRRAGPTRAAPLRAGGVPEAEIPPELHVSPADAQGVRGGAIDPREGERAPFGAAATMSGWDTGADREADGRGVARPTRASTAAPNSRRVAAGQPEGAERPSPAPAGGGGLPAQRGSASSPRGRAAASSPRARARAERPGDDMHGARVPVTATAAARAASSSVPAPAGAPRVAEGVTLRGSDGMAPPASADVASKGAPAARGPSPAGSSAPPPGPSGTSVPPSSAVRAGAGTPPGPEPWARGGIPRTAAERDRGAVGVEVPDALAASVPGGGAAATRGAWRAAPETPALLDQLSASVPADPTRSLQARAVLTAAGSFGGPRGVEGAFVGSQGGPAVGAHAAARPLIVDHNPAPAGSTGGANAPVHSPAAAAALSPHPAAALSPHLSSPATPGSATALPFSPGPPINAGRRAHGFVVLEHGAQRAVDDVAISAPAAITPHDTLAASGSGATAAQAAVRNLQKLEAAAATMAARSGNPAVRPESAAAGAAYVKLLARAAASMHELAELSGSRPLGWEGGRALRATEGVVAPWTGMSGMRARATARATDTAALMRPPSSTGAAPVALAASVPLPRLAISHPQKSAAAARNASARGGAAELQVVEGGESPVDLPLELNVNSGAVDLAQSLGPVERDPGALRAALRARAGVNAAARMEGVIMAMHDADCVSAARPPVVGPLPPRPPPVATPARVQPVAARRPVAPAGALQADLLRLHDLARLAVASLVHAPIGEGEAGVAATLARWAAQAHGIAQCAGAPADEPPHAAVGGWREQLRELRGMALPSSMEAQMWQLARAGAVLPRTLVLRSGAAHLTQLLLGALSAAAAARRRDVRDEAAIAPHPGAEGAAEGCDSVVRKLALLPRLALPGGGASAVAELGNPRARDAELELLTAPLYGAVADASPRDTTRVGTARALTRPMWGGASPRSELPAHGLRAAALAAAQHRLAGEVERVAQLLEHSLASHYRGRRHRRSSLPDRPPDTARPPPGGGGDGGLDAALAAAGELVASIDELHALTSEVRAGGGATTSRSRVPGAAGGAHAAPPASAGAGLSSAQDPPAAPLRSVHALRRAPLGAGGGPHVADTTLAVVPTASYRALPAHARGAADALTRARSAAGARGGRPLPPEAPTVPPPPAAPALGPPRSSVPVSRSVLQRFGERTVQ